MTEPNNLSEIDWSKSPIDGSITVGDSVVFSTMFELDPSVKEIRFTGDYTTIDWFDINLPDRKKLKRRASNKRARKARRRARK